MNCHAPAECAMCLKQGKDMSNGDLNWITNFMWGITLRNCASQAKLEADCEAWLHGFSLKDEDLDEAVETEEEEMAA
jgi:hypothetical protein